MVKHSSTTNNTILIIGGDGLVGSALRAVFAGAARHTSRRDSGIYFDLSKCDPKILPAADIVFLVAAMPGYAVCEGDRRSWRVNVDAQIALARRYSESFVVFVSSDAVEHSGHTMLARQKSQVEACLALSPKAAIVRPGRLTQDNVREFAGFLASVGTAREPGLYRWGNV